MKSQKHAAGLLASHTGRMSAGWELEPGMRAGTSFSSEGPRLQSELLERASHSMSMFFTSSTHLVKSVKISTHCTIHFTWIQWQIAIYRRHQIITICYCVVLTGSNDQTFIVIFQHESCSIHAVHPLSSSLNQNKAQENLAKFTCYLCTHALDCFQTLDKPV